MYISKRRNFFRVLITCLGYLTHSTFHSSSINNIAFNEYNKINDIYNYCVINDNGILFKNNVNDFCFKHNSSK